SIRTIVQRDLENGDRLAAALVDPATALTAAPIGRDSIDLSLLAPAKAAYIVRIVRRDSAIGVAIRDGTTGAPKQTGDFHLPLVPPDRSQLLRDSLKEELAFKTGDAVSRIARDSIVRDSLLAAKAAPPPKKKQNTKERAAARLIAAQRDSAIGEIEVRRLDI